MVPRDDDFLYNRFPLMRSLCLIFTRYNYAPMPLILGNNNRSCMKGAEEKLNNNTLHSCLYIIEQFHIFRLNFLTTFVTREPYG